ncbi:pancreatic triacylglycerol lipase isoform X2 [Manduca sexta]|uniref:Lipase domain-containing protein n=1 Tax=Manduca sexta TaxID=7130 RepID=A0A921YW29_MANSE|nr:pancreatic triacylglycerol lipase isoform X2 [Manduca sexta]KAG6445652.1 hypothetical protein O3G_MSEX004060 [Manduca sexta]
MKWDRELSPFLRILFFYSCTIEITSAAFLRCYKGTLEDYLVTPLDKPLPPTFLSCLDSNLPIMIYTFGYGGRVAGPATTAVLSAYIATRKRNVLLMDWEEEAKSGILGIALGYAFSVVPKSKKIGKEMGERLIDIVDAGYNMTHVHLVGHSLGAHVMGFAGRRSRESGHVVPRITGLDPARALFEGTFAVLRGLDRTCAKFVDIIHTDPRGYGTSVSTGTVDIWPNYSPGGTQPGCSTGSHSMFTPEDLCSHDRSWRYYVEAIAAPTTILAAGAPDYKTWATNYGKTNLTIYLGELTSTNAEGNFYFSTNSESPFSRGREGLKPSRTKPKVTGTGIFI